MAAKIPLFTCWATGQWVITVGARRLQWRLSCCLIASASMHQCCGSLSLQVTLNSVYCPMRRRLRSGCVLVSLVSVLCLWGLKIIYGRWAIVLDPVDPARKFLWIADLHSAAALPPVALVAPVSATWRSGTLSL